VLRKIDYGSAKSKNTLNRQDAENAKKENFEPPSTPRPPRNLNANRQGAKVAKKN
jgi:hypothetical protein